MIVLPVKITQVFILGGTKELVSKLFYMGQSWKIIQEAKEEGELIPMT